MTYVRVVDDRVGREANILPLSAIRLDNDEWIRDTSTATAEELAATGWTEVVETDRPADTDTTTCDRSVVLVGGVPTEVWVERDKTEDELVADYRRIVSHRVDAHIEALQMIAGSTGILTAAQLSNAARAQARFGLDVLRYLFARLEP